MLSDLVDENFEYGGRTPRYPNPVQSDFQKYLRTKPDGSIAKKGDALTDHEYSNHSERVRRKFKAMIENDGVIPEEYRTKKFAQRLLQKEWGDKGPSITVTSLPDDFVPSSSPISERWARIQIFRLVSVLWEKNYWWYSKGRQPTRKYFEESPKYTQIGNAVPVKLAQAIGQHIKNLLD